MKIVRRIKTAIRIILCGTLLLLFGIGIALAQQELIVYPSKGQSQEQTEKDKFSCYTWAKKQTGFDPMAPPTASEQPPTKEAKQGGVVRGGVRGGVVGLAVGAIAGDAGKGAAIGAASGALFGGMRKNDQVRREKQAQDQWAQEQTAQYTSKRNEYNRAYGACLEGKGYTVK